MNFDEAIQAHSQWKLRLRGVVEGISTEALDPQVVGVDNRCALGQWIHGEARQYAAHPQYQELVEQHAKFHKAAAEVLHLVKANQIDKAKAQLDLGGTFHECSLSTINAIRHLRNRIEKG